MIFYIFHFINFSSHSKIKAVRQRTIFLNSTLQEPANIKKVTLRCALEWLVVKWEYNSYTQKQNGEALASNR